MELLILIAIVVGATVCCFACCCLPCCIAHGQNTNWKKRTQAELEAVSEIIQTKKGPIEISKKGNAPYVLCLHGTPGIHDGYSNYFSYLTDAGFGVISPSRPGYGRTPLSSGPTSVEAADLLAALLDEL